MAEISKVLQIGDSKRPESLQRNLYKVESPYDLTDDVVTKSLNLLQSITGYDYRNNPVLDVVERLIDSKNSKLVSIGGERLLVEFGRRAAMNNLGKFIPTPTNLYGDGKSIIKGQFQKKDSNITDPSKNPNRNFVDKVLEKTLGYKDNDNYLISIYGKNVGAVEATSDINFNYSGDMNKEKIQQLNQLSVFSTYNVKQNKIPYFKQSQTFRFSYDENYTTNLENETVSWEGDNYYTKRYFKPYEKPIGGVNINGVVIAEKYTKDYIQEAKELQKEQGFGFLNKIDGFRTNNTRLKTVSNPEINRTQEINEFHYDNDENIQKSINEKFNVKRGLVYFTSKLAQENSVISQNNKQLFKDKDSNVVYYKGNGECRTFTIHDQYDNFGRVIRFDGNGQVNSVIRESVIPRIAPMIGDESIDKYNYFFTMENLSLKGMVEDCDKGPNGGKFMWFVPYNAKIQDNNTVNWSDLYFLGRPEPIFSYNNTTRSLSLSFSLLIDTVKKMQDIKPTIQNYYNYLYTCNELNNNNIDILEPRKAKLNIENITPNNRPTKIPLQPISLSKKGKYYFKNDAYGVKTTNIDYTSGDTDSSLTSRKENNNFLSEFDECVTALKDNIEKAKLIEINISGFASKLIANILEKTNQDEQYNRDLGMRRAYNMMQTFVAYYNANSSGKPQITGQNPIGGEYDKNPGYFENVPPNTRLYYYFNNNKIVFEITSFGEVKAAVDFPIESRVNEPKQVADRYAIIDLLKIELDGVISDTTPQTVIDTNNKTSSDLQTTQQGKDQNKTNDPCDEEQKLIFEKLTKDKKFPVGFEALNTFTPSFNSQTPFDFTKRYVFLHQLTRPSNINKLSKVDNTVFGRMPVFVIRYGDFIHSKAIARSINFDISEATWDFNPEGMGAIPLYCNVTMDLTLLGGQSLAGPIDRIQTANDTNFIANSTFNSGTYKDNSLFKSARDAEELQQKILTKKK